VDILWQRDIDRLIEEYSAQQVKHHEQWKLDNTEVTALLYAWWDDNDNSSENLAIKAILM
jgi:hypothetical protein